MHSEGFTSFSSDWFITATTIANPADEKRLNSSSVQCDDLADFSPPKIGELANFNFGSNPKSFDKIYKKKPDQHNYIIHKTFSEVQ